LNLLRGILGNFFEKNLPKWFGRHLSEKFRLNCEIPPNLVTLPKNNSSSIFGGRGFIWSGHAPLRDWRQRETKVLHPRDSSHKNNRKTFRKRGPYCQIFLDKIYQNGKNIPNYHKLAIK
jgi:hypothetical protein